MVLKIPSSQSISLNVNLDKNMPKNGFYVIWIGLSRVLNIKLDNRKYYVQLSRGKKSP